MTDTFRRACLVAAVVIGCAYSAFQILHDVRVPVQLLPGVAARVNGRQIDADSVNRTVAGLDARERRSESATRHDVLSRMIDEELLVQHALDSGAAETSPEVRAALVRSAITRVNAEAAAEPVSERELSEYFEAHKQVYATAARFDVTPFYFESRDASARAAAGQVSAATTRADTAAGQVSAATAGAATAPHGSTGNRPTAAQASRAGEAGANVRAAAARAALKAGVSAEQVFATADRLPFESPGQQIAPRTLANYFGPATADAVDHLAPGETTEVMQLGNGVVFIYLNAKTPGEVPGLGSIRDLVAADAMRDRQEHALENLLGSLHQSARIELNNNPPITASR
ncbi:MAG TPA: peptidyl-prolyl cis-trans isomerase [Steroidobacteraceae bacterium]|nr:peptidyl-prolyl cis-trans isomerase [Steroidobacteraceae bacterium]